VGRGLLSAVVLCQCDAPAARCGRAGAFKKRRSRVSFCLILKPEPNITHVYNRVFVISSRFCTASRWQQPVLLELLLLEQSWLPGWRRGRSSCFMDSPGDLVRGVGAVFGCDWDLGSALSAALLSVSTSSPPHLPPPLTAAHSPSGAPSWLASSACR